MTDKKITQRAWEAKLQSQQEDLDRREALIASLERKYAVMQAKADEFLKRDERLKVREDRATEIEFKENSLHQLEAELRAAKADTERELAQQKKVSEQLAVRVKEFDEDQRIREAELTQRAKDLDSRDQRLQQRNAESETKIRQEQHRLAEREAELQQLENELKIKKVQLSEEHAQVQRWVLDLRNKEEEHETYEKLMKDMQSADERAKRHIKWQEDAIQRRNAELRIAREDQTAEAAALADLKDRIEKDKKQSEQLVIQAQEQVVAAQKRSHELDKREEALKDRIEACRQEEERVKRIAERVESKEKQVNSELADIAQRKREAEIDLKRASHLRMKSAVQETTNLSAQKKLQQKEKSLNEWDDELDWRETEFVRSIEAAMNLSHEVPSFSPSHVNKAIVDLQLQKMKEQYGTGTRRRVISALQPRNRAQSATNTRATSPLRQKRPATSAGLKGEDSLRVREAELMAQSHRVALQERSITLERDFRFLVGKVIQLQETASTPEKKAELMSQYFTTREQVAIDLALHRDRDLGAEIALRRIVGQCPIANPTPSPVEMVAKMTEWWREMASQLTARDEAILHERVDQLEDAVEILRKKVPQIANNANLGTTKPPTQRRAASAQPASRVR